MSGPAALHAGAGACSARRRLSSAPRVKVGRGPGTLRRCGCSAMANVDGLQSVRRDDPARPRSQGVHFFSPPRPSLTSTMSRGLSSDADRTWTPAAGCRRSSTLSAHLLAPLKPSSQARTSAVPRVRPGPRGLHQPEDATLAHCSMPYFSAASSRRWAPANRSGSVPRQCSRSTPAAPRSCTRTTAASLPRAVPARRQAAPERSDSACCNTRCASPGAGRGRLRAGRRPAADLARLKKPHSPDGDGRLRTPDCSSSP